MATLRDSALPFLAASAFGWLLFLGWFGEPYVLGSQLATAVLFMLYPGVAALARLRHRSGAFTLIVLALAPAVLAGILFVGDALEKLAICQMTVGEAILTRAIPVALVGAFTLAGISAAEWVMAPGGRARTLSGFVVGALGAIAAGVAFFLPILLSTAGHRNPVPCG